MCFCSITKGLHHQGIFRVSGSQVEISNFREGFERGEDPLADTTDASDINSVAGVLKLYLRELREPLFPIIYFDHFVTLARKYRIQCFPLNTKMYYLLIMSTYFYTIQNLNPNKNWCSEYANFYRAFPVRLSLSSDICSHFSISK